MEIDSFISLFSFFGLCSSRQMCLPRQLWQWEKSLFRQCGRMQILLRNYVDELQHSQL